MPSLYKTCSDPFFIAVPLVPRHLMNPTISSKIFAIMTVIAIIIPQLQSLPHSLNWPLNGFGLFSIQSCLKKMKICLHRVYSGGSSLKGFKSYSGDGGTFGKRVQPAVWFLWQGHVCVCVSSHFYQCHHACPLHNPSASGPLALYCKFPNAKALASRTNTLKLKIK